MKHSKNQIVSLTTSTSHLNTGGETLGDKRLELFKRHSSTEQLMDQPDTQQQHGNDLEDSLLHHHNSNSQHQIFQVSKRTSGSLQPSSIQMGTRSGSQRLQQQQQQRREHLFHVSHSRHFNNNNNQNHQELVEDFMDDPHQFSSGREQHSFGHFHAVQQQSGKNDAHPPTYRSINFNVQYPPETTLRGSCFGGRHYKQQQQQQYYDDNQSPYGKAVGGPIFDTIRGAGTAYMQQPLFQTERGAYHQPSQQQQPQTFGAYHPMFQVSKERFKPSQLHSDDDEEEDVINPAPLFYITNQHQQHQNFEHLSPAQPSMMQHNKRKKSLEKRGLYTNYLTSLTEEELFGNTLTGFLIKVFTQQEGAHLTFDEVASNLEPVYKTLRRPNGQRYCADNIKRSLMGALQSNGLFQACEQNAFNDKGCRRKQKIKQGATTEIVYRLKVEEAKEYMRQEIEKFAQLKSKLNQRSRKYHLDKEEGFQPVQVPSQQSLDQPRSQAPLVLAAPRQQAAPEMLSLDELVQQRKDHCLKLDAYKDTFDYLTEIAKTMTATSGIAFTRQLAVEQLDDHINQRRTQMNGVNSQTDDENEQNQYDLKPQLEQLEGFLQVYSFFRPLFRDNKNGHQPLIQQEERPPLDEDIGLKASLTQLEKSLRDLQSKI